MPRLTGATTAWLLMALSVTGSAAAQGPSRPRRPAPKPSGGSGVKVIASEADPNALAAAAAPALAQAAADFTTGRKALPAAESGTGGPAYAAEDLTRLLSRAEGSVRQALGDPELAPLHDRAALAFRRARAALGGGQVDRAAADRALDALGQFLDQLATLAKGPATVDLCVISKPDPGARFSLRPAGNPSAVKSLPATDGAITAVRGLYAYRLEPMPENRGSKGKAIQCGWEGGAGGAADTCLDLFDDAKTPLVCDFAQGSCARAAGTCP
jgi:hypothetical protein